MKITPELLSELADWLDNYWTTYLRGDLETWATFIKDDYYNIGGTKEEIWHSKQEILDYTKAMADQLQGQAEFRNQTIEADAYGEFVMLNEFTDMYVKAGEEWIFYGHFRMSSLMEKTETSWIVLHQHGSFPDMKAVEGEAYGLDAIKAENERLKKSVAERTAELELQKKELVIEAALERVRTQSIAMHSSSDVGKCIVTMFAELTALGVDEGTRFGIGILNHEDEINQVWTASKVDEDIKLHIGHLNMTWHPLLKSARNAWKAQTPIHVYQLEGVELLSYYQMLNQAPDYKIKIQIEKLPAKEIQYCFIFEHGFFYAFSPREFQHELIATTQRFTTVFAQTYQRYLDLVKAEAQARESEIQLALERVRAKTMAMYSSSDLGPTSAVLFQQIADLGFETWSCGFCIWKEDDHIEAWMGADTAESSLSPILLNYKEETTHHEIYKSFLKGESSHERVWEGQELKVHYDYMQTIPSVKTAFAQLFEAGLTLPTYQCYNIGFFKQGYLMIITKKQNPELKDLSVRFANVFEQTYTRFLDLQKAEAQAREAKIETALERVRSRSMAMHNSNELRDVVNTLHNELRSLNVNFHVVIIQLLMGDTKGMNLWVGTSDGLYDDLIYWPYVDIRIRNEMYQAQLLKLPLEIVLTQSETKEFFEEYFKVEGTPQGRKAATAAVELIDIMGFYQANTGIFLMRYSEGSYSVDEKIITERFSKVFEQTYTRFLDLQKAEAQAREAKIEAALEKIRARTMGMQHSDELPEAANLLFLEVQALGIPSWSAGYNILAEDKRSAMCWMSSEGVLQKPFQLRLWGEESFDEMGVFVRSNKTMLVQELADNAIDKHYAHMKSFPDLKPTFDHIEEKGLSLPTYQINHLCKFTQGFVLFITYEKVPEAHDIFQRFTKVFEQTFTRFLDLQKAEAQAREAKIETALEKVRSRTMGMQKAEELGDVATVLFSELNSLVENLWTCGFVLCEKDRKEDEWWLSLDNGLIQPFFLPNVGDYAHESLYEGWEKGDSYRTVTLEGKKINKHYDWLMNIPVAEQIFEDMESSGIPRPNWQRLHAAYFKTGYLVIITEVPCAEEEIFKRFANVFEQTYTRFLDLQKAEAQAREAEIQLALERVRARTMAMQKQDDLLGVLDLLVEQLTKLGVQLDVANFSDGLPEGDWNLWVLSVRGDGATSTDYVHFPKINHPYFLRFEEDLENYKIYGTDLSKAAFTKEQKDSFLDYCSSQTKYRDIMSLEVMQYLYDKPGYAWSAILLKETWISICRYDGIPFSDEEDGLLRRFANSFGQAYTRFLDLQKAEAQAREAIKQASLDRVRGEIASMRSAADLELITPLIFRELTILRVPFIRCGVFIIQEKEEVIEAYLSSPDGNSLGALRLPFQASELTSQSVEAWRKGLVYRQHWNKEDFIQWIKQLMEQDQIQDSSTYQGSAAPPESLDLHFVPFTQGMLYVGALSPLSEDEIELVQSLANAFSIAFARYEDFVKLEQAKAEVESAMSELKATQSQLIQQEKLASLGQLTAGIAHEIKNPLNFINNFSEVSIEMIEEALEERSKSQESRDETLVDEILEDIKSNLQKVHEHGSRANGIVTSMLQHSRGSSGKMEPTNLNALIKEYANLAYHGMRAGKNPIDVDIVLELDPEIGEIPLIKEDFTRVIINLCNNAFDAMRGKLDLTGFKNLSGLEEYHPKLTVHTKTEKDNILIEVADNGPGIPDEIKDKILQPFFTTKKGTEGTGLGLSITHDIIKAHGGDLKVESREGEGATFHLLLFPK